MSSSRGTGAEPPPPESAIDARVLGRLLLVQSTLHVMPHATAIAEFVCAGLRQVPGVTAVVLDLWPSEPLTAQPPAEGCPGAAAAPPLAGPTEQLPLEVLDKSYGTLTLVIAPETFEPYRPHAQNLANVAAIAIENRRQRAFLERMAADLQVQVAATESAHRALGDAHRLLEARVQDRTADLQRTNEALAAEIQERRQAEAALRASEERLRLAQQAAQIGIWDMNLESGDVRWSHGQAELFGLGPETRGMHVDEIFRRIHPDDQRATIEATARAIEHGEDLDTEFRVVWDDTSIRWLVSKARVFAPADGIPRRMLGVNMDVTQRRVLEEHLLQAQKLESIGRLAGGVAHDFNNLLTAILGYADMASAAADPDDVSACLREIRDAGQRASNLTQQLLAFARRQIICPQTVDLNDLVLELGNMLRRLIGEQVELVVTPAASPASVRIDPGQFTQILMNLAVNARDAMPRGGRLRVTTRNESVPARPWTQGDIGPGEWVALEVSDTGVGMAPETRARAFEPFFTTKPPGEGTGLGLATCYGIIEQSGGHIRVASEPGMGSTFTIYLPAAEEPAIPVGRPETGGAVRGGDESILVAEDDEGLRTLAVRALRSVGYDVVAAADGAEALERVQQRGAAFDLLVTDVVMPRLGGVALAGSLAERGMRCPVLFVSGYSALEMLAGVLSPTRRFLQKPFSAAALLAAARELLDQNTDS